MYLNKHEGSADSFQTGHQSWTLKAKHSCSRCSKSFQFAFQLRSHLRCHLIKSPSAYVHDMKNCQNESTSQFRLLNEEIIESDDADPTFSKERRLSSGENNLGFDKNFYTSNSASGSVRSKSEYGNSEFSGLQGRKRKSGQTLAEICGKLEKSKSLKKSASLSASAVSSDLLAGCAEKSVENLLEGNSSEKHNSQNVTQNKSRVESCNQYQGSTDTLSVPQNVEYADAVTDHDNASVCDKQENKPQNNTNLLERVNSEIVFKTSQRQVTLGNVDSAEPVVPLANSSEFQESSTSQSVSTNKFICPTCGLSYSKNSGLSLHLLAHRRREMVVKFKRKALSKSAKLSSRMPLGGSFTETSKQDQITDPHPEGSAKESVSTVRSDISEEEYVGITKLTKSKSVPTPSTSNELKQVVKNNLKRECNLKGSESEYLSESPIENSEVCGSECEASVNSRTACSSSSPIGSDEDLKGESLLTQNNDLGHKPPVLKKTRKSLDKQQNLSTGENTPAKQNSPKNSCYKKKMEVVPCQYCYALVSKRNMSRHRSIHCPVLTLPCYTRAKCHICMITLQSQELAHHLEVVHGQGVMRMRSCKVCFKDGFVSFAALQEHKKEHFLHIKDIDLTPQESYDGHFPGCGSVCPVCNTETLTASNIRAHIVSHMVDKDCSRNRLRRGDKFWCPVCLKSFELNTRIENHIISHWKIKLYKCPSCVKQFTRFDAMGRHCSKNHKTNITNELADATNSLALPQYITKTEAVTADDQSDM